MDLETISWIFLMKWRSLWVGFIWFWLINLQSFFCFLLSWLFCFLSLFTGFDGWIVFTWFFINHIIVRLLCTCVLRYMFYRATDICFLQVTTMAFFGRIGSLLRQTASRQVSSKLRSPPSFFQAIRCMSCAPRTKLFIGGAFELHFELDALYVFFILCLFYLFWKIDFSCEQKSFKALDLETIFWFLKRGENC